MVTENDVRTCMSAPKFEKLDEIHCGLDDGMNTITFNVSRIRGDIVTPVETTAQFLRCALDNIDSALTAIAADQVSGFEGLRIETTLRRTSAAMNNIDSAVRRGRFSPSDLSLLEEITHEVKRAQVKAFNLRVTALTNCLL